MSIISNIRFGAQVPQPNAPASTTPKTPATYWLNLGYLTDILNEDGEMVSTFVSLVQGIALDTMAQPKVTNGSSKAYRQRIAAQMELRDDLLTACEGLEPGEDKYLEGDIGGLRIQLHRVKEPAEAIEPSENPFRRKMTFA